VGDGSVRWTVVENILVICNVVCMSVLALNLRVWASILSSFIACRSVWGSWSRGNGGLGSRCTECMHVAQTRSACELKAL
jgi:hypothetical protein